MKFSFTWRAIALLLLAYCSFALAPAASAADDDFLEPDQAFKFSARMLDPNTIAVSYEIADGYYMYRERFKFAATGATLGVPQYPPGKVKFDNTFQKNVETYRQTVTVTIPVSANGMFTLTATSQGCADKGLCYAPQEATVRLVGAAGNIAAAASAAASAPAGAASAGSANTAIGATGGPAPASTAYPPSVADPANATSSAGAQPLAAGPASSSPSPANVAAAVSGSDMGSIAALLGGGKLLTIMWAFLLLGLGLAFTPCVLPMVPILSGIIVGEGAHVTRMRGFALALTYSLGMAIVYTALGVAAGLAGEGLSAALQNPYVLGAFGLLMVAMALSMFGFYELQLPAGLQTKLATLSGRQRGGKLPGVFIMGALSALIVGPCVAAPLAGALVYLSQTRDVLVGGAALFAMAIGMSIPLLLVGLSAGSLLPRTGAWMQGVKRFFGVLLLAMALWLVSPVLPAALQMLLWSALGLGYGCYLLRARHWAAMALGAAFAIVGAVQLVGVVSGGRDALAPLAHLGAGQHQRLVFTRIKTVAQLDQALAQLNGKTAVLDFYADWCVSCKEMEKLTFTDPQVRASLANSLLLQIDVTANDADDKAMLKRFHLFGPPGIILFDSKGQEIPDSRVIGYQDPAKFLTSLQKLN